MPEERPPRKLAVILHADVVGSTTLVQRDEALAHERIRDAFRRLSESVGAYGGIVHETRGDALVAEFSRASDAVCAALRFQSSNATLNAQIRDEIVPAVRVGIALGEEVIADDTVTGTGVVLAQRVEQLSPPGGVCVTAAIYEALPQRLPFAEESLGEQRLKGIDKPARVYRVYLEPGASVPEPEPGKRVQSAPKMRPVLVAAAAIALLVVGGVSLWLEPWAPREEAASVERTAFPLPDKPSIAVLPFENMSDDPGQEYFADGITEDLTTDLSKISGLFVIARNSAFAYKGKAAKPERVARELGVRYVLEGSVRRSDQEVRVNAQLIDATTGGHVWAERYDGSVADIFSVQDEFIHKIVKALAVNLTQSEQQELGLGQTSNVEARERFQEGWEHYLRYSPENNATAVGLFAAALELDPDYGRAHAAAGLAYLRGCQLRWNEPLNMSVGLANSWAISYVDEAKKRPSSLANVAASMVALYNARHEEAVTEATRAIAKDPNDPEAYIAMAWAMITTGEAQTGLELVGRAMRLNPNYPNYYELARGMAYFAMDDLEKAARVLARALERDPGATGLAPALAASYARLGRRQDARAAAELWKPGATQAALENDVLSYHFPYKWSADGNVGDRFSDALRVAVLPLETTVSTLLETLEQGSAGERRRAVRLLSAFGPAAEPAVPGLIEALQDEDKWVQRNVVRALGKVGPAAEAAVPALTALKDDSSLAGLVHTALEEIGRSQQSL